MSLKKKAVSGVVWTSFNQFGQVIIQFAVGLMLARLLRPEDYGLVAMTTVITVVSGVIADGGLGLAIVQRKDLSDDDCSTAFWLNIAISLVMYAAMFLIAPFVADFYNEPVLTLLLRVAGLRIVIGAFSTCHFSLLERNMAFRKAAMVQLPSFVIGSALAIWMALAGYGPWALIALSLSTGLIGTLTVWKLAGWTPRLRFQGKRVREMIGFGINTTAERVTEVLFNNLYVLVIGKFFNPVQVGYYNRAQQFQNLPSTSIHAIFSRVLMPMLSSLQGDRVKLRSGFIQSLHLTSMASFPIFAGMAAVSRPMVVTLIGEKWEPCVPYLQILCLMGAFIPFHALNITAILSQGKSALSLRISIYKKVAVVVALLLTFRLGIIEMLWGQVVVAFISLFVNAWPNRRLLGIPVMEQLQVLAPYVLLSSAMGFGVWYLVSIIQLTSAAQLTIGTVAGAVVYAAGLKLMNNPAHRQIAELTRHLPGIGPVARFLFS